MKSNPQQRISNPLPSSSNITLDDSVDSFIRKPTRPQMRPRYIKKTDGKDSNHQG